MAKWKFIYSLEDMPEGYTESEGESLSQEEANQMAYEDGQRFIVADAEKIEDE